MDFECLKVEHFVSRWLILVGGWYLHFQDLVLFWLNRCHEKIIIEIKLIERWDVLWLFLYFQNLMVIEKVLPIDCIPSTIAQHEHILIMLMISNVLLLNSYVRIGKY